MASRSSSPGTNNYGPYQFPEKLIPLFVTNLIDGKRVPLYGNGSNQRDWLHVDDHCRALTAVIEQGEPGTIHNIGAGAQVSNLELTQNLLAMFDLDESWIDYVADRPGHYFRYAVDSSRIRALGWSPAYSLVDRLAETVVWYRARRDWWEPLKSAQVSGQ
jgi:dTDP-glucose 4,6-dehydratase